MKKAIDWFNKQQYGVVIRKKGKDKVIDSLLLVILPNGDMHVAYKGNVDIKCVSWSKRLSRHETPNSKTNP